MISGGECLRFALEPGEAFGISRECIGKDLDRDLPTKRSVRRAVDLPDAPGTDGGDDLLRSEARTRLQ
jgi:hypothetical protein